MSKIYLLRHGQTMWNRAGRKQGQLDSPLTGLGINQATIIASHLYWHEPYLKDFIWLTSPLGRCKQFSALLCEKLGINWCTQCTIEPLLMEHSFGLWEGKTEEEIEVGWPGQLETRRQDWWNYIVPEGESYGLLQQRVAPIFDRYDNTDLVIVAHEMVSKVLRGFYTRLDHESTLALKHPQNVLYLLENGDIKELV